LYSGNETPAVVARVLILDHAWYAYNVLGIDDCMLLVVGYKHALVKKGKLLSVRFTKFCILSLFGI